jgi:outer membrane protein TolC
MKIGHRRFKLIGSAFLFFSFFLFVNTTSKAQQTISLNDCIKRAIDHHPQIAVADAKINHEKSLKGAAVNLPNPQLLFQSPNGTQMRTSVLWVVDFPTIYMQKYKGQQLFTESAEIEKQLNVNQVIYQTSVYYTDLQYSFQYIKLLAEQDLLLEQLLNTKGLSGAESLERTSVETRRTLNNSQLHSERILYKRKLASFNKLIGAPTDSSFIIESDFKELQMDKTLIMDSSLISKSDIIQYYEQQIDISKNRLKIEKQSALPGLMAGYFNQGPSDATTTFYRLNFGITVPLFFWQYTSRIKAAKQQVIMSENQSLSNNLDISLRLNDALGTLSANQEALKLINQEAVLRSTESLKAAYASYGLDKMGFYDYCGFIDQSFNIQKTYLEGIKNYNNSVMEINYILNINQ